MKVAAPAGSMRGVHKDKSRHKLLAAIVAVLLACVDWWTTQCPPLVSRLQVAASAGSNRGRYKDS